jgi:aspartyl-tRNA(Asn)/glutamyl-tRNA(Gln) amidotransferase subunit A
MIMLLDKSIKELHGLLQKKEISSVDLVKESFEKIEKLNGTLNNFITLREKKNVLSEAEEKDKQRTKDDSILSGIPYSLKDAYITKDLRTTSASKILDDFIPPYSATVVNKMHTQGAIVIGKNNMDAWGHGGSTENTDYGVGKNPWDITRIPGGSGGGSASAIAARMVSFAISEDTGGSIRNPAGMCNISALKVTYGRVSRYGAIAYASSLDSVGPTAKSVEDLAYILEHMAGQDKFDATSSSRPVPKYSDSLGKAIKGKRIGLPKEFFGEGLDPECKEIILTAAKKMESLGAEIVEVSIPYLRYGVSIYYLIAMSETSSNLARYDGIRFGNKRDVFTPETMRRILIGTYALSAGYTDKLYKRAQKARTVLIEEFDNAYEKCDAILAPIIPGKPRKIGELINDPLQNLLEDLYTVTANSVGIPSLALPAGFSKDSLPVGMQLYGKKFAEEELLQIGHAYQQATDWHMNVPSILKNEK